MTFLGEDRMAAQQQAGVTKAMYTQLISTCIRQPDRTHDLMFDTPIVTQLGPAKAPAQPKKKTEDSGVHSKENDPKPVEGRPLNTKVQLQAWQPAEPDWDVAQSQKP